MKDDLIPGILEQAHAASPEAAQAQRMAELKDLAEYRARHLQAYIDWADPVKRAAKIKWAEDEQSYARTLMSNKDIDAWRVIPESGAKFIDRIKITEMFKPKVKVGVIDRVWGWFTK